MRKYYEQTELVLAEVTITTRLIADSQEDAQRRFDEGDWEARHEMIGNIRETLRSDVTAVQST